MNRMTLTKAYIDGAAQPEDISNSNSEAVKRLLSFASLCCDGTVIFNGDGSEQHIGDPTETAIIAAAHKNRLEKD